MTIAEWDGLNKWLDIDDLFFLRNLVHDNMQFEEAEEAKDHTFKTVLNKLNTIISEVIPSI